MLWRQEAVQVPYDHLQKRQGTDAVLRRHRAWVGYSFSLFLFYIKYSRLISTGPEVILFCQTCSRALDPPLFCPSPSSKSCILLSLYIVINILYLIRCHELSSFSGSFLKSAFPNSILFCRALILALFSATFIDLHAFLKLLKKFIYLLRSNPIWSINPHSFPLIENFALPFVLTLS